MPNYSAGSASVNIVPDFTNAQRMIGRWFAGLRDIQVDVNPNLDQAAYARIQAELRGLPKMRVQVEVDQDRLSRSINTAANSLAGLTNAFGLLGRAITPTLWTTAIGGLTAITGAVSQAAGALFLLPAAAVAAAAPIAVLALGTRGLGDAFKAVATGDAVKMQEALGKLAPAARTFVTEVYALKPAFDQMQLSVQQNLFAGLGDSVQNLARADLPLLQTSLGAIATEFGRVGRETLNTLASAAAVRDFGTTLDNVRIATSNWANAARPMTQIWIDLATVGSSFLPQLTQGLANVTLRTAEWVAQARASGQLNDIIAVALDRLAALGALLFQVGATLVAIFRPAMQAGADLIQILTQLFNGLNSILSMETGRASLVTFFNGVAAAIQGLLPGVLAFASAFVNAVLPAVGQVLAALGPLVGQVLVQLAGLLTALSPIIPIFGQALMAVVLAASPLVPVLTQIVAALLPPLFQLITALTPIVGQLGAVLSQALLTALYALQPVLPLIASSLIAILNAFLPLLPVIVQLAGALLPPLVLIFAALIPVIVQLAQILLPILVSVISALTPIVGGLASSVSAVLVPVLGFLADHLGLVITALGVWQAASLAMAAVNAVQMVGGLDGVIFRIGLWIAQLGIVQVATNLWAAAQAALNIVLSMNPIGLVIIALAALAAGFIALWNTSEGFRAFWIAAWDMIKTAAQAAWEGVIKPAWDALIGTALFMWNGVLAPTWAAISAAWNGLLTGMKWAWDNILHPMWDFLVAVAQALLQTLAVIIFLPLAAAWLALLTGFKWAWDNILHPTWVAIEIAAHWLWENVLAPIWAAMQDRWNSLLTAFKWAWDNILHPAWVALEVAANWLWRNVLSPIWDAMGRTWDGLMRGMRGIYDGVIHPMWTIISGAVNSVRGAFDGAVNGIRDAWNRIQGIAAVPINFVVRTVLRDGLFSAWNWVLDRLGIKDWHVDTRAGFLQGIPGYAAGGQITDAHDGRAGGRVPGTFLGPTKDNVLARLNPNEFVIQQPVASRIVPFLTALNAGQPEAVQAAGGWYAQGKGLPTYAAGGNVEGAIAHARKMQGTPYIWGGVGPGGADCSGFMSQLTNVLRGRNPYQRVGSTANFPWPGFTNGFGEPFSIGSTNNAFNSGIGHMAGTLGGHAVESGSGHGPMIDGRALNAGNKLFGKHAWLSDISGAAAGGGGDQPSWFQSLWGSVTGAKDWLTGKIADVTQLASKFGVGDFTGWLGDMVKKLPGAMWDKVSGSISSLFSSMVSGVSDFVTGDSDVKRSAQAVFANFGWGDGVNWNAVNWLVNHESSWNPRAQNPSSTASGLFQFIDSTWRAYRAPNTTAAHMKDASIGEQAGAGARYIKARYGSPAQAMSFWQGNHWYDQGGWLPPGVSTVWNATGRPEPVLTAAEHDGLLRWRSSTGKAADSAAAQQLMGDVHIHAEDRRAGEIMDELWHRLRVARRGGVNAASSVYTVG